MKTGFFELSCFISYFHLNQITYHKKLIVLNDSCGEIISTIIPHTALFLVILEFRKCQLL